MTLTSSIIPTCLTTPNPPTTATLIIVAAVLGLLIPTPSALAEPAPPPAASPTSSTSPTLSSAPAPGWFLPTGINLGVAIDPRQPSASFIAGAEVSAAYLFGTAWAGLYGDGLYDVSAGSARVSAGAEVGWFLLGLEAGYTTHLTSDNPATHGLRLGAIFSFGLGATYTRWSYFPTTPPSLPAHLVEVGVLLKWPWPLSNR
jgi:hypothetical protein